MGNNALLATIIAFVVIIAICFLLVLTVVNGDTYEEMLLRKWLRYLCLGIPIVGKLAGILVTYYGVRISAYLNALYIYSIRYL